MKATSLFKSFFKSEQAGGIILIVCTIISLFIANSNFKDTYHHFWQTSIGIHNIEQWVNDGLMAIFFLLIGLELKREIFDGELKDLKNAALPIWGAIGGMIIPASIYFAFNIGTTTQHGVGIPMATDIAFAIGVLSLLGNRVPTSLKVFLTALAVIDDLGAIIVIAIFYTQTIVWTNLLLAITIFLIMALLNYVKVNSLIIYIIGGVVMWYCMLHSGIHATIAGVLLAFAIPYKKIKGKSISAQLQHALHYPVAFIILPIFALANTAISLDVNFSQLIFEPYSIGIILGLVIGKPFGIFMFAYMAIFLKIGKVPKEINMKHIFSVSILGGIGFTMSIFITLLAFNNAAVINDAKLVILLSSLTAGILGLAALQLNLRKIKH